MKEIQEHKIKIYEFPETDDEEENKIVKKIKVTNSFFQRLLSFSLWREDGEWKALSLAGSPPKLLEDGKKKKDVRLFWELLLSTSGNEILLTDCLSPFMGEIQNENTRLHSH